MAKKNIKFTLDTIDSRYSPVGTVKQLDSVFFYIKITENGVTKDLTGQTIKLFAIKEDKKIVEQTTKINITNQSEGLVEIELLNAAIQVHGFTYFELEISDSNGIISTADFILRVNKRVGSDEAIESTNEVSTLKKVEAYVAKAKVELEEFKKIQSEILATNGSINTQETIRANAELKRTEAELERTQAENARIEADKLRSEKIIEVSSKVEKMETSKISPNKTTFFYEEILNLIDSNKLVDGWLNGAEPNGDSSYKTTDFIPVEPETTYVHSGAGAKCRQYTKDKQDNGVYESGTNTKANTYFVRMSTNNLNSQNWRMNKGSVLNEYVPFGTTEFNIKDKNLKEEIKEICKTEIESTNIIDQIEDGEIPFQKTNVLIDVSENLIDINKLSVGYMANGIPNGNESYRTTDFIPVELGESYVIITSALNLEKWGYDENKTNKKALEISGGLFRNDEESNIKYVRFVLKREDLDSKSACIYKSKVNLGIYPLGVKNYEIRGIEKNVEKKTESGLEIINCNLYNNETLLENGYYLNPDKIDSLTNVNGSDFIKIDSNKRYIIYTAGGNGVKTYNKYKYITPTNMFREENGIYTFEEGVHYITVNSGKNITSKTYVSEFSYNNPEVKPYNYKTLDIKDSYFDDFYNITKYGHLRGKLYGSIGDSISAPGKYQQVACDKLQLKNNSSGAVSSARYCDTNEQNKNLAYYNMDKLPHECDIVTIMLGTNDVSNDSPIGEFFDDTLKTFYGALHLTFKKMIEKFPNARLGVITPPQRKFNKSKDLLDKHLKYSNIIKEVAEYYSLPVLWGQGAGVRCGFENDYNHFIDGVHFSEEGYKSYGVRVSEFVATLPIYK